MLFRSRLRPLSYPYTDIFLMCFSVVNHSSFQNITKKWLSEVVHHWPEAIVMLVGTKIDLRGRLSHPLSNVLDMVTHEEGECMAKHHNCMLYIETSALSGQNLHVEFHDTLARCALIGFYMRRQRKVHNNKERSDKLFFLYNQLSFIYIGPGYLYIMSQ